MILNNKYSFDPKTDLLGVGGFGRVYKARNIILDKEVALKMVTVQGVSAQYSLIEEVKKTFGLEHPNIIRYYDVFVIEDTSSTGEETETQVGVMEYIPHGDISQLDWFSLSTGQQKDILLQIIKGLQYLHKNSIIHRDIKPANILIKKEGDRIIPKITDFGISKSKDAFSISVSRIIGSIPYMAPEQFDSKGRVGYNTDFWSLGILVYRLFTGDLPFGDESTTSEGAIMKNIMEMPLPGGGLRRIALPFRTLVELCLVKDREERVKDANILGRILKASNEQSNLTDKSNQIIIKNDNLSAKNEIADKTKVLGKDSNNSFVLNYLRWLNNESQIINKRNGVSLRKIPDNQSKLDFSKIFASLINNDGENKTILEPNQVLFFDNENIYYGSLDDLTKYFYRDSFLEEVRSGRMGMDFIFFDFKNVFWSFYDNSDKTILVLQDVGNPHYKNYIFSKCSFLQNKPVFTMSLLAASVYTMEFFTEKNILIIHKKREKLLLTTYKLGEGIAEMINTYQYKLDDSIAEAINIIGFIDSSDKKNKIQYNIFSLLDGNNARVQDCNIINLFDILNGTEVQRKILEGSINDRLLISILEFDLAIKFDNEEVFRISKNEQIPIKKTELIEEIISNTEIKICVIAYYENEFFELSNVIWNVPLYESGRFINSSKKKTSQECMYEITAEIDGRRNITIIMKDRIDRRVRIKLEC